MSESWGQRVAPRSSVRGSHGCAAPQRRGAAPTGPLFTHIPAPVRGNMVRAEVTGPWGRAQGAPHSAQSSALRPGYFPRRGVYVLAPATMTCQVLGL